MSSCRVRGAEAAATWGCVAGRAISRSDAAAAPALLGASALLAAGALPRPVLAGTQPPSPRQLCGATGRLRRLPGEPCLLQNGPRLPGAVARLVLPGLPALAERPPPDPTGHVFSRALLGLDSCVDGAAVPVGSSPGTGPLGFCGGRSCVRARGFSAPVPWFVMCPSRLEQYLEQQCSPWPE